MEPLVQPTIIGPKSEDCSVCTIAAKQGIRKGNPTLSWTGSTLQARRQRMRNLSVRNPHPKSYSHRLSQSGVSLFYPLFCGPGNDLAQR